MTDVFDPARLDAIRSRQVFDKARPPRDGNAPLPFDRDELGRMVREAWVRWAETQPNPKPSWLVPYAELAEPDKEADRQIGEAIARWTIIGTAARHAAAREAAEEIMDAFLDGKATGDATEKAIASAIARATAATRAETIEECAKVATDIGLYWRGVESGMLHHNKAASISARKCADAAATIVGRIRALGGAR